MTSQAALLLRPAPARALVTGLVTGLVATLAVAGCGRTGGAADASGADASDRELTVLAAASLTEPFTELAHRFEAEHPGVEVATGFDSSATIAAQVTAGARADVVATADNPTMQRMAEAGVLEGRPLVFTRNVPALVVPPDNPAGIARLADLEGTDYVACSASAPCGRLTARLLDEAGVTTRPRSLEVDVKAVLTKVMLGEADAGIVYASDVVAAGDRVREVPLPTGRRHHTAYPISVTSDADTPGLAREFVALVRSPAGQQVLRHAGFRPPRGASR